jgi:uncharacterized protein YbcC (UPF0753/DUF2309 family)
MNLVVEKSWEKIATFWPLKNLIAVNPLAGFEDLQFEEALIQANAYFQIKDLPNEMQAVNRESIKWLQAFLDDGQATIKMPLRNLGLLNSVRELLKFDNNILSCKNKLSWLMSLPDQAESVIAECLLHLRVTTENHLQFLTLMLTTLPGWAAHIKYCSTLADCTNQKQPNPITKEEYLAFRLIITCLLWPEAIELLDRHANALQTADTKTMLDNIYKNELFYYNKLLKQLSRRSHDQPDPPDAQLVFCIDVRSEPFRRAIEAQGRNETLGFAGFFGIPLRINNEITGEKYNSCPVILKPMHDVEQIPSCDLNKYKKGFEIEMIFVKIYQSLKYNFTTTFALVEMLGIAAGLWMATRTISPNLANKLKYLLKEILGQTKSNAESIDSISFEEQCKYAASALGMMALKDNFAPLVVLCGHGSATQNNPYATILDCGACGGRHSGANARILAKILNKIEVRNSMKKISIIIPDTTYFIAGEHNTTTDSFEIYGENVPINFQNQIERLKEQLERAREKNCQWRCRQFGLTLSENKAKLLANYRAHDWAEVRPEWGLACNGTFIIGPRTLTKDINLDGRAFLHSYDWTEDNEGIFLTTILTTPVVVAQWINCQYLFSTLDNVAFGSGSKITQNIVGKIGIMQGNASDIMNGLPLQAVFVSDKEQYHTPLRLLIVIYAPITFVELVINKQAILKKLFGNGWLNLACIDPVTLERQILNSTFG